MTRHRIAIFSSVLRVLSLLAGTAVAFFLMPFIVHRLGDQDYGYWALVASVLGYYGVLDLGIVTAVQFEVAKSLNHEDPAAADRTISTAVFSFAILGSIILILTIVAASLSKLVTGDTPGSSVFRSLLLIMGTGFAVGFPGRAFTGAISAHLRFDLVAFVGIFVLLVRTGLIVLVIGGGGGVISLAVITIVSDAIGYVLSYLALRSVQRDLHISVSRASFTTFKQLFKYGGYALMIQISDQLRFFLDGWVVSAFVGIAAVTHYSVAGRLSQAFLAFIIASVGILSPWFSQLWASADLAGIRRVFMIGTRISATLSTIVGLSLVLYGRAFIDRWMGHSYLDAYWPLVILVAAIYLDVAQLPSVSYMFGVSRHRFLAWTTLSEGVSNVALSIVLGSFYGMSGVALGTLVPMAIVKVFVQPVYICRHLQISIRDYYLGLMGRSILPPALASFGLWIFVFRGLNLSNTASVCVVIACQGLICAVLSIFLVFTRSERRAVIDRFTAPSKTAAPIPAIP